MELKARDADYCNLKFILMFLVVYGHLIEGRIDASALLMQLYRLIYTIHMPLFLFLSGLFVKGKERCLHQMRQILSCYFVCQTGTVLGGMIFGEDVSLFTPVWHLWYLLSLGCMAAVGCGWYRFVELFPGADRSGVKLWILAAAIFLACGIGGIECVGRGFSLSRTIVFLPYFLGGLFCPGDTLWRKHQRSGLAALGVFVSFYCLVGVKIPVSFLYQADAYGALSSYRGMFYRLVCYLMAADLGFFLLSFTPGRRFRFSKMGTDTFMVYLLHAPFIKLFQKAAVPKEIFIALSPFLAFYIILFLYKAFQWKGQMYAIRLAGRKNGGF